MEFSKNALQMRLVQKSCKPTLTNLIFFKKLTCHKKTNISKDVKPVQNFFHDHNTCKSLFLLFPTMEERWKFSQISIKFFHAFSYISTYACSAES